MEDRKTRTLSEIEIRRCDTYNVTLIVPSLVAIKRSI